MLVANQVLAFALFLRTTTVLAEVVAAALVKLREPLIVRPEAQQSFAPLVLGAWYAAALYHGLRQ